MTECLTPTEPTTPCPQLVPADTTSEEDFDKYYFEAVKEALKISKGEMLPRHFDNLVMFIICFKAGLI